MSTESVSQIIGKALVEPEFRNLLFSNPEAALSGFELTEEEKVSLSTMKAEDLNAFASLLEKRESKIGFNFLFPGNVGQLDMRIIRQTVVTYG